MPSDTNKTIKMPWRRQWWPWEYILQLILGVGMIALWFVAYLTSWPRWVFITLVAAVIIALVVDHLWPMEEKSSVDTLVTTVAAFSVVLTFIACGNAARNWVLKPRTSTAYLCRVEFDKDSDYHKVVGSNGAYEIGPGTYFGKIYVHARGATAAISAKLENGGVKVRVGYHYALNNDNKVLISLTELPADGTTCG